MAQKALFFTTNGTGDGAVDYTQAELFNWINRSFGEGILRGYLNELNVANTGLTYTVATGAANVRGAPYYNDAVVTGTFPTSTVGTTGHRIVLRKNYAAQTVRVTLLSSTDGIQTLPSLTQTANVTWDFPLANITITTGGVVTITDARTFASFSDYIVNDQIANNTITAEKWNPQPTERIVDEAAIIVSTQAFDNFLIQQGFYDAELPLASGLKTIFIEYPTSYVRTPFGIVYRVGALGDQNFSFVRNFTTSGISVTYSSSPLSGQDVFLWFASGEAL